MDSRLATSAALCMSAALALPGPAFAGGTVDQRPIETVRDVWDWWVRFPATVIRPAPELPRLTKEIRDWTGWSKRKLATALNSTHPTVTALEEGRSPARTNDLFARLLEVHDVVSRTDLLAGGDAKECDRLLSTSPPGERPSALDLLAQRRPADAYLAVLDVLRPRRPAGMMQGIWPARAGEATESLETDLV